MAAARRHKSPPLVSKSKVKWSNPLSMGRFGERVNKIFSLLCKNSTFNLTNSIPLEPDESNMLTVFLNSFAYNKNDLGLEVASVLEL